MDTEHLRRLLRKYPGRGPRYTSYPAAPHFTPDVGSDAYSAALRRGDSSAGISFYVHVPFCEERCTYCGCYVIPTLKRSVAGDYLRLLDREVSLLRDVFGSRVPVESLHLGGGTPTYLAPGELIALFESLGAVARLEEAKEVSVEVDPRVTTGAHLETLRDLGTRRISMGVQDTSAEVQEAIGRRQTLEETRACYEECRRLGFEGVNIDLVYGLPRQTLPRLARTLEDVVALRPDRLAVYGYAHVPWLRPQQKRIDPSDLPDADARLDLYLETYDALTSAGYLHIGMDHFALPGDELARAQEAGHLGRNFMGYTPWRDSRIVGLGVSAIGDAGEGYFQNEKKLSRYSAALESGRLPIERGVLCGRDDVVRRHVITEILCNLRVRDGSLRERFGVPFATYFARELEELEPFERDGLVETGPPPCGDDVPDDAVLRVTPGGRLFLRNLAMVFDRYLRQEADAETRYSRTL